MAKHITANERLQLIGLLALAQHHNKALKDIVAAAVAITDERDSDGHTSDAVYNDNEADELLAWLDISVTSPPTANADPPVKGSPS